MFLKNKLISLLLFTIISTISFSQTDFTKQRLIAEKHILQLHDSSVLIVRLQTKEKSIEALIKAGNTKTAEKIKLEQQKLNQQIINAFNENFTFCKVYFMYSNQSLHILNQEYSKIIFLNNDLQEDSSIKPNFSSCYVAEFGVVASATMIQGLAIMDKNLNQLEKPFPYYAKNPFFASKSKFTFKTVKRFNSNLHNYYKSVK